MGLRRAGRRRIGLGFTCMIALALMGASLDALPVSLVWCAVGSEDGLDDSSDETPDETPDDSSDDFDVDEDVSWLEFQPGIRRREPGPAAPAVEIATPA